MATIKSTFSMTATGGSKLSVSMSKEANSTIDREVALTAGEFVEVFNMDVEGFLQDTSSARTPLSNSLPDYKQLVAYNAGNTPIELALKTPFIDDADGAVHAELYSYPVFFIPVGGYLVLPSPRMVSLSGTLTTPVALNYVTDETKSGANRCLNQASLRATVSTASYVSNNKKVIKRGLSAVAVTNANGDLNIANLHGLANSDADSGGSASAYVATDGIVPGTVRVHFYEPAYTEINYTKNSLPAQTSATSTLLAVNTAYDFALNVDGAGSTDIRFTTHTSDVTWGSPTTGTGVLYKIQAAMDAAEKNCDVSLVDGNIRFTSRSRNSTSSAVVVGNPAGGVNFRTSGTLATGLFEATAVQVLDDDDADVMFDNGSGVMSRANGGSGVIGYGIPGSGTGVVAPLYITGAPANSSIKLSWLHGSSSGGNLSTVTPTDNGEASNSLLSVYARALSYGAEHGAGGRKGKLRLVVVDNQEYSSANY